MKAYFIVYFLVLYGTTLLAQQTFRSESEHLDVLIDSATIFYNNGNYGKSLDLTIQIIDSAKELGDTSNILNGYRYLGYDYLILNDTLLAKESFEKAYVLAKQTEDTLSLGLSYMDLANLYGSSPNKLDTALKFHDKSIEQFKILNDTFNLGTAYYNTVYTLFTHDNYNTGVKYLLEADRYKDALDVNLRIGIQNMWAEYYLQRKDYEKVDNSLTQVFKDTTLHVAKMDLADSYYYYSKSLFAQEKYKEAYLAAQKYQELFSENVDELQNKKSQEIAVAHSVEEYRQQIARKELENQLQQINIANKSRENKFLIILSAIVTLLIIVLLYVLISRKNYIKTLKTKNAAYLKAKQTSEELALSKSQFFSTVSHELRTPLYGVIGLTSILLDDPTLSSHKEDLKSLKFSADYLLALINDVLQINKVDSKSSKADFVAFSLRELIATITSSFQYMRLQNNNRIHTDIDETVPEFIKGDTIRLSQVLMNLIGNACKFTQNGTISITVRTIERGQKSCKLHFSIKDTGTGIPSERKERIFDEFSQIGSKQYSYQGTGLGLPIVKKLLTLHNSEIKLESTVGKGSNFHFELAFAIAQQDGEMDRSKALGSAHRLDHKKILVVDDNRINQKVTQKILERANVVCTMAENGAQAVALVKSTYFDMVLMDIHMPILNGMEATREIRTFNKTLPIIALTAVEIKEMREEIYNSGMNDIIVKPYDLYQFKLTISRNLITKEAE